MADAWSVIASEETWYRLQLLTSITSFTLSAALKAMSMFKRLAELDLRNERVRSTYLLENGRANVPQDPLKR
jgi:hypothetical protein